MQPEIVIASIDLGTGGITTAAAHGLTTGWAVGVGVSSPGTLPAGLDKYATYWAHAIDATTLSLHASPDDAADASDPMIPTTAGDGDRQLMRLSVRERVLRQVVRNFRTMPGVGNVETQDPNGNPAEHGDVVIWAHDATATPANLGDEDSTRKSLPITAVMIVGLPERAPFRPSSMQAYWLAQLEIAAMSFADGQFLIETGSGVPLADNLKINAEAVSRLIAGQTETSAQILFTVTYPHPGNDPFTLRA